MNLTDFDRRWRFEPQTDEHVAEIKDGRGNIILFVEEQQTNEAANSIAQTIIQFPDLINALLDIKAVLRHNMSNGQIDAVRSDINKLIANLKLKK